MEERVQVCSLHLRGRALPESYVYVGMPVQVSYLHVGMHVKVCCLHVRVRELPVFNVCVGMRAVENQSVDAHQADCIAACANPPRKSLLCIHKCGAHATLSPSSKCSRSKRMRDDVLYAHIISHAAARENSVKSASHREGRCAGQLVHACMCVCGWRSASHPRCRCRRHLRR
jgi:hypothetical protein